MIRSLENKIQRLRHRAGANRITIEFRDTDGREHTAIVAHYPGTITITLADSAVYNGFVELDTLIEKAQGTVDNIIAKAERAERKDLVLKWIRNERNHGRGI